MRWVAGLGDLNSDCFVRPRSTRQTFLHVCACTRQALQKDTGVVCSQPVRLRNESARMSGMDAPAGQGAVEVYKEKQVNNWIDLQEQHR